MPADFFFFWDVAGFLKCKRSLAWKGVVRVYLRRDQSPPVWQELRRKSGRVFFFGGRKWLESQKGTVKRWKSLRKMRTKRGVLFVATNAERWKGTKKGPLRRLIFEVWKGAGEKRFMGSRQPRTQFHAFVAAEMLPDGPRYRRKWPSTITAVERHVAEMFQWGEGSRPMSAFRASYRC